MKSLKEFIPLVAIFAMALSFGTKAQKNPSLTDPEIASVAVVANQVDISYAKIALEKSKNADVRKFAQTMSDDHNSVIKQAVALVTKLHVTPKDNAVSQKLESDAAKTRKMLHAKKGHAFNQAYINNEVTYHKAVISAVEGLLIPQAQNSELKKLLQDVMPTLRAHLEHAEMVQKMFNKK